MNARRSKDGRLDDQDLENSLNFLFSDLTNRLLIKN